MFIAALLTMAKKGKQPRCPVTDEWIKKMQNTHIMEHHSALKRS
jgi:hypothetical protein